MSESQYKPIIGISCTLAENKYHSPTAYSDAVLENGGLPFILPYSNDGSIISEYAKKCDGFLLAGGVDIDPSYFGETVLNDSVEICAPRDTFEWLLIDEALRLKKPILGICRGAQVLNVKFGGTLYQDIAVQLRSNEDGSNPHRQHTPWPEGGHNVTVLDNGNILPVDNGDILRVNTYHHQTCRDLASNLTPIAVDETDGTVEAFYAEESDDMPYIAAVQWHPELIYRQSDLHRSIFTSFIAAVIKSL